MIGARLFAPISAAILLLLVVSPTASRSTEPPISPRIELTGCYPIPITPDSPTGIAGCVRWGAGIASTYGPGRGVAMNFCTWARRHSTGCGSVSITSQDTGRTVTAAVIDFGDLYTGTPNERIIDLQYGVVEALGLDLSLGLWPVIVEPVTAPPMLLPNTSTR